MKTITLTQAPVFAYSLAHLLCLKRSNDVVFIMMPLSRLSWNWMYNAHHEQCQWMYKYDCFHLSSGWKLWKKFTICIDPIFHNSFFFSLSFSHRLVFIQSIWIEITLNRCMVHTTMYEGEQISIHCLRAIFLLLLLCSFFCFLFFFISWNWRSS